jgi:hypothetical protein
MFIYLRTPSSFVSTSDVNYDAFSLTCLPLLPLVSSSPPIPLALMIALSSRSLIYVQSPAGVRLPAAPAPPQRQRAPQQPRPSVPPPTLRAPVPARARSPPLQAPPERGHAPGLGGLPDSRDPQELLAEIRQQCAALGQPFVDPDFRPSAEALGSGRQALHVSRAAQDGFSHVAQWLRVGAVRDVNQVRL